MGESPCMVPVRASDALLWVKGELTDADLLLNAPLRPECVFVADLPCRSAYRQMLSAMAYWRERGAVCLIYRTATQQIQRKGTFWGVVPGITERHTNPPYKTRYMAPPEAFGRWCHSFTRE